MSTRKCCKPTLKYYAIMADNYARFAREAILVGDKTRLSEYARRESKYRDLAGQLNFEEGDTKCKQAC